MLHAAAWNPATSVAAFAAAAREGNLLQGVLLVALLALPLLGANWPSLTAYGVDAVSFAILGLYVFGMHLIGQSHRLPMWLPRRTAHTRTREPATPERRDARSPARLWIEFCALAGRVLSLYAIAVASLFVGQS
jgi:cation:H+ antiporter